MAADRGGGVAGCRRRPAEDRRARVAAAEHGYQRLDGGAVRRGVGDGMDRPACRRAVERVADEGAARRREVVGCRYSALHAAVRPLRRATRREHQPRHRLEQHATARHRADRRGEGRPPARRPVDQRAISARSARRPAFRFHIRVGHRRRRRAERVVALAVDDLVGDVVARGCRRHAGRLVQPSPLRADRRR